MDVSNARGILASRKPRRNRLDTVNLPLREPSGEQ